MTDGIAGRLKDLSPRLVKDVANGTTRAYGMRTSGRRHLPDFMVIGTKRGGTTSLWNYLVEHAAVMPMYPPSRGLKSPWYFYVNYERGDAWYRSHFATEGQLDRLERQLGVRPLTGEACPYYLYCPRSPGRIAERMPDLKMLVVLRDPVKRAYSHYWESVNKGVEDLGFEEALAAEAERTAGELERIAAEPYYYSESHDFHSYRDRGVYLPQLRRWVEHFPRERFLIMSSEELYRDEQAAVDRVCGFLGLSEFRLPRVDRHNYRPAPPMRDETAAELTEFYRPHNRALFEWLGEDLGWAG